MAAKVDQTTKDSLWVRRKDEVNAMAALVTQMKPKARMEAIQELCRSLFDYGLEVGYDIGYYVTAGETKP